MARDSRRKRTLQKRAPQVAASALPPDAEPQGAGAGPIPSAEPQDTADGPVVDQFPIPADLVQQILLGPTNDRRVLQDSPILGDVWLAYAADPAGIQALIREQMRLEPAVADDPEPVILVQSDPGGTLSVEIRYADAQTAEAKALTINVPVQ